MPSLQIHESFLQVLLLSFASSLSCSNKFLDPPIYCLTLLLLIVDHMDLSQDLLSSRVAAISFLFFAIAPLVANAAFLGVVVAQCV